MITLATAFNMFKKSWHNFAEKKISRMIKQRALFSAFRLKFRLKIKIKRYGLEFHERFRRRNIRNNLLFDGSNMMIGAE
jgi:hypothetical protein